MQFHALEVVLLTHHQSKMCRKLLIKLIKYYPVVMNVYISFMMVGYINNLIIKDFAYTFIGQSFYINIILFILSLNLRFCLWHRILIVSMSLVLSIETFYNFGYELNYYLYICAAISIIALITFVILITANGRIYKRVIYNIKKYCKMD